VPASIQTFLVGRPAVGRSALAQLVGSIAASLVELAEAAIPCDGLGSFASWISPEAIPPPWSTVPRSWQAAMSALTPELTNGDQFIHRDFHPGNVLFSGRAVSGVVDWVHACRGPIEADVSRCRVEIALLAGIDAADDFLVACRPLVASYDPLWDALVAAELAPWLDSVAVVNQMGGDVTIPGMRVVLDDLVARAAASLS
jgi:hypothetical protein